MLPTTYLSSYSHHLTFELLVNKFYKELGSPTLAVKIVLYVYVSDHTRLYEKF